MAAHISDALHFTVDYIIVQSDHMVLDKNWTLRIEYIEALPNEEKDKSYCLIDMALDYNKNEKAFAH